MAMQDSDWTVDRTTGNIRYIGDDHGGTSPSYATVIQFHRWLQDKADDAVSTGDDELDITQEDPSDRSTDNIITLKGVYNIDANASEHLYDGSIIQSSGDTVYDGIVNFGNSDVQIQIIQDGSVITDDWWNFGGGGLNADANAGISHRFMILVRDAGSDIDGRRLIGTTRTFGNTYAEFSINGTARGNNVLALSDSNDLNNETAEGTVSGWTTITNLTEGYASIDVDNDGTPENYYSEWDKDTYSINQFYERMKWLTRDGSASTLYGINGELFRGITHEVSLTGSAGTWNTYEEVTWTGGSGQMLAIDSTTSPTTMWIQLLTGSAPTDTQTITGGTSSATANASGSATDRSSLISAPFVGNSTGSAIIGSYGFGIQSTDLTDADKLFDLTNTQYIPPNYVTNTVAGVVSGEDRILVAPWDGVTNDNEGNPAIDKDQLSLDTALTTDNITEVQITEAIPSDTPSSGWIRVTDDNGLERRLHYNNWENGTPNRFYNIDTADGNEDFLSVNASVGNDVYIAYLDVLASSTSESYTGVYSSDRDLVVVVRDGGGTPIKQFISEWSFGDSNSSITVIRTSDE